MKKKNIELFSRSLIEKLQEWGKTDHTAEIVVDCFLSAMELDHQYDIDDQLELLKLTENYFNPKDIIICNIRDPYIIEVLNYHMTSIKVNYGY